MTTSSHITGIRTVSIPVDEDAEAAHAYLSEHGVDTGDILRWPGTPAMFAFRDPDGNGFSITETA